MSKRSSDHAEPNLYVRKEMRTYLGDLSKSAFGARGKWRKLATQYGLDVFDIKEQMEAIIKFKLERLADAQAKKDGARKTGNDTRNLQGTKET